MMSRVGGGGNLKGKACYHLLEGMKGEMVKQGVEFEDQGVELMVEVEVCVGGLVVEILAHYPEILWGQMGRNDLVQEGSLGLCWGCAVEGWGTLSGGFSKILMVWALVGSKSCSLFHYHWRCQLVL